MFSGIGDDVGRSSGRRLADQIPRRSFESQIAEKSQSFYPLKGG